MLTRRAFGSLLSGALPALTFGSQQSRSKARPPNWIILLCDDLGYGDPGCYGSRRFRTPNIDKLASQGARLTEFYAAPTCTPARAALLTGRYPVRSGLTRVLIPREHFGLPETEITLASVLKEQGYKTACVGKWHLGDLPPYRPNKHGFDEFYGLLYSNDMTLLPAVNWPPLRLYHNDKVVQSHIKQKRLTEQFTDQAVRFIRENSKSPFLLYVPYTAPHLPCAASEEFAGRSSQGCYGDVVEEVDASVGEILKAVREQEIEENTAVMFTSDNGPEVLARRPGGDTGGLRGGKRSAWEGGVRMPCIVRWPGRIPAGIVKPGITSVLDVFPTVVRSGGGEVPTDRAIDGMDLMPFLKGDEPSPRSTLAFHRGATLFAVRSEKWKLHFWKMERGRRGRYTRVARCQPEELYDLEGDPGETCDLSQEFPEVVANLRAIADQYRKTVPAGRLPPARWRSVLPTWGKRERR